jgi:hypothetical protein
VIFVFKDEKSPRIDLIETIEAGQHDWCGDAALFEVTDGQGALRWITQTVPDDYYGGREYRELMFHDTPILQMNTPGCPTCAGLLAAGCGIENANSPELQEIAEKFNAPYNGLTVSLENMKPLLGLLGDGFYVLADCEVFPSDGIGNFFWNMPNAPTENQVTAWKVVERYGCVEGVPAFLHPSQGTDCFNPERAEHYRQLLSGISRQRFPRAIAYHCNSFSSILLDGHHKAAACAALGVKVPCLVIVPCTGWNHDRELNRPTEVFFNTIKIDASKISKRPALERKRGIVEIKNYGIIKRDWEQCYLDSRRHYPTALEYAEEIAHKTLKKF